MSKHSGWLWFVVICGSITVFLVAIFARVYAESGNQFGAAFIFRTYPGLLVAMASGFFGAAFSMLLQTRKRASEGTLEDLSATSSWHSLIVRASVGLGAAAILYFFFRSGLLEGNLWPDLDELGFDTLKTTNAGLVPNEDWCLLIIWCFIAGFSETFVPNILGKTEKKSETT